MAITQGPRNAAERVALIELATRWLERQKATNREPMLDEGDCLCCGSPAGEGHEITDPCGMIAALLALARE